MNPKEKIEYLKKKINEWNYEYYGLSNPSISDYEYDINLKELQELESHFPEFKTDDSPTIRVGGIVSDKFNKIIHKVPMLSLSNAFNKNDLIKFNNDIKKNLQNNSEINYCVEPKIDGLSISLIYKDGILFKAITRGDGKTGEDVTNNVRTIKDIPLSINYKKEIEVRGEIFFTKKNIEKINKTLEKPFANARNAAAGTIRNLDSSIVSKRNLNAIIYNIPDSIEHNIKTQKEVIKWLKNNKFNIFEESFIVNNIDEAWKKIQVFEKNKEKNQYEIDGVVIKINNIDLYDDIGYTSKFPKWAIAYKFPAKVYSSKLTNILLSVGRTGKINYIGKIEKINIDGTIIQNATLHNYEYICSKNIMINDYVKIYKAGEIIPKIIGPIIDKRDGNEIIFKEPEFCPSCKVKLNKIEGELDLYCFNENCDWKIIESINHFCSREAMNIKGLSIKIIKKLYESKLINNFIDLYYLKDKKDEIIKSNLQIKEKTFNNLINEINNSKKNSLEKLIFGLGIRHIGEIASKAIAKKYLNIKNLKNINLDSLIKISDLGNKMADSIINYFNDQKNISIIDKIIELNISNEFISIYKDKKISNENEKFKNKKVVITGKFSNSRNNIKSILEELYGSKIVSKVSKSTDYLIIGEKPTLNKIEDAKKHNIDIIDYEFWK